MILPRCTATLGLIAIALLPTWAGAQGGRSQPAPSAGGRIAPPAPARPLVGFGTLRRDGGGRGRGFPGDHGGLGHGGRLSTFRSGFGSGLFFGPEIIQTQVVPVPVPYPVTYYVPIPWHRRPAEPAPVVPYDPTRSKGLIIGTGADGGGGVMRMQPLADSALRITWLGAVRPIREARIFLADSLHEALSTRYVTLAAPTAVFRMREVKSPIAFAGLTIIFADGVTTTTLVPYQPK
jgi:hypothetical protein